jgi:hypothetical protein
VQRSPGYLGDALPRDREVDSDPAAGRLAGLLGEPKHEAHHDLLPLGRHLRHLQAPVHQDVERLRLLALPEHRLALPTLRR